MIDDGRTNDGYTSKIDKKSCILETILYIIDANDAPTVLPTITFNLSELAKSGDVVGSMEARDEDTTSLYGTIFYNAIDTEIFEFSNHLSNLIVLSKDNEIDYESKNLHEFTVVVEDYGGLSVSSNITINIIDENDPPTIPRSYFFEINDF